MIYLTQLLCPQQHCLIAVAWDEDEQSAPVAEALLCEGFQDAVKRGNLNPFCGLCRSETLHCESRVSGWRTLEEALPHLLRAEQEQLLVAVAAASHT